MLWHKSWLDTRWQFLIGLVLVVLSACGAVITYPRVAHLMPVADSINPGGGLIGREVREALELARTYRGYIWSQTFRQNLLQMATLFAALLGSGNPFLQGSKGASMFTLSLPVTRTRLLGVRAAAGLSELLALAVAPAIVLTVFSVGIGQSYSIVDAIAHAICLFFASSVFFSLAFLLSTQFTDLCRPWLLACGIAIVVGLCEMVVPQLGRHGIFAVMSGETYFRNGALPWLGLFASAAASATMLYVAAQNLARQDF